MVPNDGNRFGERDLWSGFEELREPVSKSGLRLQCDYTAARYGHLAVLDVGDRSVCIHEPSDVYLN